MSGHYHFYTMFNADLNGGNSILEKSFLLPGKIWQFGMTIRSRISRARKMFNAGIQTFFPEHRG
ncbi:MAG: hypothetical protein CM1200mP10_08180 [Candidatus Neomarinimicrobiota bacterium]|nr:MAG: hypothetical protein CM1200mP10_08180 [Candidatus Neomarinimicrobiota bacterium]